MTSSFVLKRPDVFPVGSAVDCYELPASMPRPWPTNAQPPLGDAVTSDTVDPAGELTFTGLTDGKRHVAVAEVGFTVDLLDGGGVVLGTIVATEARPFSIVVEGAVDGDWTGGVTLTWDGGTPVVVGGAADLDDVISFVSDNGGALTLADGISAGDGPVADGFYVSSPVEGSGGYRRVYFSTPGGAVSSAIGSTVVSYDAAEAASWPSWRRRRRNLGLV